MITTIVGFLTGIIASLGLGGGFILIIYLVDILNTEQITAQGINLVFFLPIAVLSLIMHTKNKMVEWRIVPQTAVFGALGAIIGTLIALNIDSKYIKIAFAVMLIAVGIKEIFFQEKKTDENKPPQ